jgi:hypothetical protein
VPILTVITAFYGHDLLEQYFKHNGPVIDSEPNHVINIQSGEVYRNIAAIKLKYYTSESGNKFTTMKVYSANIVVGNSLLWPRPAKTVPHVRG